MRSSGTWDKVAEGYTFRRYSICASYNGQIGPVTVLD